jgi:pyruvate dehydrogenase E1 component
MGEIRDLDHTETREWIDAIGGVVKVDGKQRAQFLLDRILEVRRRRGVQLSESIATSHVNTVPVHEQEPIRATAPPSTAFGG